MQLFEISYAYKFLGGFYLALSVLHIIFFIYNLLYFLGFSVSHKCGKKRNNTKNNEGDSSINKELNQVAPLTDNNAQIIPQGSNHPIPKFRQYSTKDDMVRAAFDDGRRE